jgi:hypothetical protein
MTDKPFPYLTMITPSRNDNYGGNMLARLQFTIDILFEQINRHKLEAELIIIDWNPPKNRPTLKQALSFPEHSEFLTIRILEVSEEIHQKVSSSSSPINVIFADNAAIYRARGKFSVLRVSDIIWSEELLSFLSKKELEPDTCYRLTRCDIDHGILNHPQWSVKEKLAFCKASIRARMNKIKYYIPGLPDLKLNSDGDFQLMSTSNLKKLHGYKEARDGDVLNADGLMVFCAYVAGIKDNILKDIYIYKIGHKESYNHRVFESIIPFYKYINKYITSYLPADFSGTFIKLMRMSGLTRLFYDNKVTLINGVPQATKADYYNLCRKIANKEMSHVLNGPDWGLQNEDIIEYSAVRASWDIQ